MKLNLSETLANVTMTRQALTARALASVNEPLGYLQVSWRSGHSWIIEM